MAGINLLSGGLSLVKGLVGLGENGNPIKDIAEVFTPNAENQAVRDDGALNAKMAQFAAEFRQNKNWFDSLIDGINRLPRPLMAFGVIALFVSAMTDPVWFSARMTGLALVPEPLWWLLGAVVYFYFDARKSAKSQNFQQSIAQTVSMAPQVVENIKQIEALRSDSPGVAGGGQVETPDESTNPALDGWKASR